MAVNDFWKSVFRRRCTAAGFWSGAVGICVASGFGVLQFCCGLGGLSPGWDVGNVLGLLWVWLCAALFAVGHSLVYSVPLVVHRRRLEVLRMARRLSHVLFVLLAVSCSATATLATFGSVHGAVLAFGVVLGLWIGVGHLLENHHHLRFPLIQQPRLFQLKEGAKGHVLSALWTAGKALRVFALVYVATAPLMHSMFGMPTNCASFMDALWQLASPFLLLHLLLTGWMVCTIWNVSLHVFTVFLTQPMLFPVVAVYSGEADRTLSAAFAPGVPALFRSLALQDLWSLAFKSPWRRQQVYSLDQAGRSKPWDELSSACLGIIERLTKELAIGLPMATDDPPPLTLGQAVPPLGGGHAVWPPSTEVLDSPLGVTHRRMQWERARVWQQASPPPSHHAPVPQTQVAPSPSSAAPSSLVRSARMWCGAMVTALLRKRWFVFFQEELPNSAEQVVFMNFQADVWAIEAVSELAKCSLTEDKFGVVQKDLPSILSKLIQLSKSLDAVVKCPVPLTRSKQAHSTTVIGHAKYAVKAAVLLSLNKLVHTFRDQHRAFQLSRADAAYLQDCSS